MKNREVYMTKKDYIILVLQGAIVVLIIFFIYGKLTEASNDIDKKIVSVYKKGSFVEYYDVSIHSKIDDNSEGYYEDVINQIEGYIEYNDIIFCNDYKNIDESDVGKKLDRKVVLLRDDGGEVEIDIFEIVDVSGEMAIAVKGVESERYNIFYNTDYNPKDMGEFINAFGIDEYTEVSNVKFGVHDKDFSIEYDGVSNEYIMENILSKAGDKIGVYRRSELVTGLHIYLEVGKLRTDICILILNDGDLYVSTTLGSYTFVFEGGEGAVSREVEFIDYINNNYEGKINHYIKCH